MAAVAAAAVVVPSAHVAAVGLGAGVACGMASLVAVVDDAYSLPPFQLLVDADDAYGASLAVDSLLAVSVVVLVLVLSLPPLTYSGVVVVECRTAVIASSLAPVCCVAVAAAPHV